MWRAISWAEMHGGVREGGIHVGRRRGYVLSRLPIFLLAAAASYCQLAFTQKLEDVPATRHARDDG